MPSGMGRESGSLAARRGVVIRMTGSIVFVTARSGEVVLWATWNGGGVSGAFESELKQKLLSRNSQIFDG